MTLVKFANITGDRCFTGEAHRANSGPNTYNLKIWQPWRRFGFLVQAGGRPGGGGVGPGGRVQAEEADAPAQQPAVRRRCPVAKSGKEFAVLLMLAYYIIKLLPGCKV